RGFLHRRLSTISVDTLGIVLCTSGSHHSHRAAQCPCINFKRKVRYRTNELDKGISRRNRKADSGAHSDSRHLCSNDAEVFFDTIVITRYSTRVVIHHSSHTDRREETVDLQMFLQMIGPAVQ